MGSLCQLADVKAYIGVTSTATDALLTTLITNASAMVEAFCNRVFAQASFTETRNGTGKTQLCLANTPVTAVASLSVDGIPVAAAVGATGTGYVFDALSVYLRGAGAFGKGVQNVAITYTAGFATVPPDVAQACIELVALKFAKRERIDKQSETLGTQQTISYSMADMPAQVKAALQPYVRVAFP